MNLLLALPTDPPPEKVTPGFAGFLTVFVLAIATVLLLRSMVGHLRKVRYSPDPADEPAPDTPSPDPADPAPDAAGAEPAPRRSPGGDG